MNKYIMETLAPLGVPVSFMRYNQTAPTYIVFLEYNQTPMLNGNNEELYTERFFQVDIFSDGNYMQLVKDLKELMKNAGFGRMFESETYDEDMNKYRKTLRFSYFNKKEGAL